MGGLKRTHPLCRSFGKIIKFNRNVSSRGAVRYLITGTVGFVGFHLAKRLLDEGNHVIGFDGITRYYDVRLKRARHAILERAENFRAVIGMLEDGDALRRAGCLAEPDVIVHLAAQAGVRYSLENPKAYVDSNIAGSWNILELAEVFRPKHLLLASTSSVYGANQKFPFAKSDRADEPMTLYAATKKSMEAMAHCYAHLYDIPTTAFRFFTVWTMGQTRHGLVQIVEAMFNSRPIEIYGDGTAQRDVTYIDDLVEAITRLIEKVPTPSSLTAGF